MADSAVSSSHAESSTLCKQGCGFFGNANFNGMCSKCYNDKKRLEEAKMMASAPPKPVVETTPTCPPPSIVKKPVEKLPEEPKVDEPVPEKKKKNRCHDCRKKVGLNGFECKCGFMYCNSHRYPDQHSCQFDHKTAGLKDLSKKTADKVSANKMEKL